MIILCISEAGADIIHQKAKDIPSLLWLAPVIGIDVPLMMDFIALLGIIISFVSMVWGRMRDMTNFTLLWMLYFSLFQVNFAVDAIFIFIFQENVTGSLLDMFKLTC